MEKFDASQKRSAKALARKGTLFPLGESTFSCLHGLSQKERQAGIRKMARATGEYRPLKKGEWYLSGAKPEAYKAPNDLSQAHVVAEIVKVKKETRFIVLKG